jgi:GPH family glycoside/pentoside/hexuronide:cation symporter
MQKRISLKEKIGFSLGDGACHIVFDNVMFYMMFFYTDIYKIPAAFVGTLFLVARVFDAVSDPLIGIVSDRTNTRWGKFRPYILFGAVPFGLICALTYTTPSFEGTAKLVYAAVTYTLLTLLFSIVNVPYCSLGDTITDDAQERISLQTWRFFISGLGGMLSTVLLMPLVNVFGAIGQGPGVVNQAQGYSLGISALAVVTVVLLLICFATTHERIHATSSITTSVKGDLLALLGNDQWRIAGVLNILNIMQWSTRGGAMVYYVTYFLGNKELFVSILSAYSVGSILGVALGRPLTGRFCKIRVFIANNAILCVLSALIFFIPPHQITLMFILTFVLGFFHQMMTPIQWVIISDTVDYGEWKNAKRLTGISFASMLFVLKLGLALSGALIGWVLSYVGYVPNAASQSPAAMNGILALFTLAPALMYLGSVIACQFYALRGKYFDQIGLELAERRAATLKI